MEPIPYFTAIGCNRDGRCLQWDHDSNLVAYAGSNLIAVYNADQSINSVIATMKGHTQDISTLNFFPKNAIQHYKHAQSTDLLITKVVSGCFGGKLCIFDLYQSQTTQYHANTLHTSINPAKTIDSNNKDQFYYQLNSTITIPNTSILHAQVFSINKMTFLVACTSTGGIFVYAQSPTPIQSPSSTTTTTSEWFLLQELYVHVSQLVQCLSLTLYSHPTQPVLLLALGGVDGTLTLLGSTIAPLLTTSEQLQQFISQHNENKDQIKLFVKLGSLKGHRDWIRDISFSSIQYDNNTDKLTKVFLATASQDKTIRILSIQIPPQTVLDVVNGTTKSNIDEDDKLTTVLVQSSSLGENGHLWSLHATNYTNNQFELQRANNQRLFIAISLETVLFGHENWVMSLEFYEKDAEHDYELVLLSVSTDRTIIEWKQQDYSASTLQTQQNDKSNSNSLWIPVDKIGEGLGFLCYYGGCYGPNANAVIAVSYNGALSLWYRSKTSKNSTSTTTQLLPKQAYGPNGLIKPWYPIHCPTGHNLPVLDVIVCNGDDTLSATFMANKTNKTNTNGLMSKNWNGPLLPYILTLSQDQTTRAYAPFVSNKISSTTPTSITLSPDSIPLNNDTKRPSMIQYPWYELARAQIHGWDLCSLSHVLSTSLINNIETHHHEFISAGEEKVLRLFRAPALFIAQLYAMTSDIQFTTQHYKELISVLVDPNIATKFIQSQYNNNNDNNTNIGPESPSIGPESPSTTSSLPKTLQLSTAMTRSLCAVQPKLGLSNKPLLLGDEITTGTELEINFGGDLSSQTQLLSTEILLDSLPTYIPTTTTTQQQMNKDNVIFAPPFEEQLAATTLWSEVDKLYGHGYDISTLTTTSSLHLQPYQNTINSLTYSNPQVFSANNARSQKNGGVRQWGLTNGDLFGDDNSGEYWSEKDILYAHQQTISCMVTTKDNSYVLSVGRDMQITIFNATNINQTLGPDNNLIDKIPFKPIAVQQNAHTRQIFNCTWLFDGVTIQSTPIDGQDNTKIIGLKYFATCARDKTIKIWSFNPSVQPPAKSITLIQTLKVPTIPTALFSILNINSLPITTQQCDEYFKSSLNEQECRNCIFVGYENGDIGVFKSTLSIQLQQIPTTTTSQITTLPYSIHSTTTSPTIQFQNEYSFNTNISHNATVNKITAFPQVVSTIDSSTPIPQTNIHIVQKGQHVVLVTVSNDHSIKMFGIDM